jgi:hypothetical protein
MSDVVSGMFSGVVSGVVSGVPPPPPEQPDNAVTARIAMMAMKDLLFICISSFKSFNAGSIILIEP